MFRCTVVCLFLACSVSQGRGWPQRRTPPQGIGRMSREEMIKLKDALVYLRRYGYLHVDSSKTGGSRANDVTALRRFQEFMGLNVTATYDDETMAMIYHPRCGLVDPVDSDQDSHQQFTLLGGKWNKTDLTYKIQGSANGLPKKRVNTVVEEAFNLYTPHVPLTFTQVSRKDQSDIEIHFQSSREDPSMDGNGKSVGRAYPPLQNSIYTGKIYLDAEEEYTIQGPEGIPLLAVVAHEIGHVLGIGHTSNRESIMTPCVPDYVTSVQLAPGDIEALEHLYGNSHSISGPEPANRNALCQLEAYDAVSVMDGYLFVFHGDKYWKVSTTGDVLSPSEGALIAEQWPEVEANVDVVYKNSLGHVVITKGGKYYEYDVTGILFPWAPRSTREMNLPKNADAGYSVQGTAFFMRGGKLWFMDEASRVVHRDSPMSIRKLWGVSFDKVDTAFLFNDYLNIIDGMEYQRLDASTAQLDQSGPRNFVIDFLGC